MYIIWTWVATRHVDFFFFFFFFFFSLKTNLTFQCLATFRDFYKSTHWCMGPVFFFFVSILWCSSQSGNQSGKLFSQIWLHTRDMKVKTNNRILPIFFTMHWSLFFKNLANWIFLAWNLIHFFPWKILDCLLPYVTFEHKFPHVHVPRAILCGNQNWLN